MKETFEYDGVTKKIKCPFCFTESDYGVQICTGCHANVKYNYKEESSLTCFFGIGSFILSIFISYYLLVFIDKYIYSINSLGKLIGFSIWGILIIILSILLYKILITTTDRLLGRNKNTVTFISYKIHP